MRLPGPVIAATIPRFYMSWRWGRAIRHAAASRSAAELPFSLPASLLAGCETMSCAGTTAARGASGSTLRATSGQVGVSLAGCIPGSSACRCLECIGHQQSIGLLSADDNDRSVPQGRSCWWIMGELSGRGARSWSWSSGAGQKIHPAWRQRQVDGEAPTAHGPCKSPTFFRPRPVINPRSGFEF